MHILIHETIAPIYIGKINNAKTTDAIESMSATNRIHIGIINIYYPTVLGSLQKNLRVYFLHLVYLYTKYSLSVSTMPTIHMSMIIQGIPTIRNIGISTNLIKVGTFKIKARLAS